MGYFADILTRFSEFCQNDNIVLSNLSRQPAAFSGTQLGFFGQKALERNVGFFLKRFVFPPECPLETLPIIPTYCPAVEAWEEKFAKFTSWTIL